MELSVRAEVGLYLASALTVNADCWRGSQVLHKAVTMQRSARQTLMFALRRVCTYCAPCGQRHRDAHALKACCCFKVAKLSAREYLTIRMLLWMGNGRAKSCRHTYVICCDVYDGRPSAAVLLTSGSY
jgi:hypothetical protein